MRHLFDRKILFFGGKGGVGKTTCASAAALAASRQGKRVLLVSTDPAHSTSDIFEIPFGATEREILPGLTGIEIDAQHEARRYVEEVKKQIAKLFSPAILKEAGRQIELAATMPGAEDVAVFDRMTELIIDRNQTYDVIVFDTAPTGQTLRLLRMPELLSSWISALSRSRRAMVSPEEDEPDPILAVLDRRRDHLEEVRALMMRSKTTAFVLVLIPERLPIEEATRALGALAEAEIAIAGVVVNRVLPDQLSGAFYESRRRQEQIYLDEVEQRFAHLPRLRIPQFESDVYGLPSLERVRAYFEPIAP
jgi:arsenite-transporting ATPase